MKQARSRADANRQPPGQGQMPSPEKRGLPVMRCSPLDVLYSLLVLAASTAVGYGFYRLGFSEANIIIVYILGVLLTAVLTSRHVYSLVSAAVSVLLFNYLFTEPRFSLNAYDTQYLATFPIMFVVAFLTSSLAVRLKRQARQAALTARRTQILFDTNQQLGNQREAKGIIAVTCRQLTKLLNRDLFFYRAEGGLLATPQFFTPQGGQGAQAHTTEGERAVADWVYQNQAIAGATTQTLSGANCLYLPVVAGGEVNGVVAIAVRYAPLDDFESSIVLSILRECALALQKERITREREEAALLAKNEQLRANLLRSISHDLRTPLTSISGNAGILLSSEENMDREKRRQLYTDIYDDALWLINLVENLLSVTRIEDGTMKLRRTTELLDEIIAEALHHTDRRRGEHLLEVKSDEALLLVKVDARLIVQVLINLVDNAIKYTPPGSRIVVEAKKQGKEAVVTVSDNGKGVPDAAKAHIFDMFYTANVKGADSRRSLGLGLALCKTIIAAHGGTIAVADASPHGAVFTFTLPIEEVKLHE